MDLKIQGIEVDFKDNKILIQLNAKDTEGRKRILKLESEIIFIKEEKNIKLINSKLVSINNFNIFEEVIMKTAVFF